MTDTDDPTSLPHQPHHPWHYACSYCEGLGYIVLSSFSPCCQTFFFSFWMIELVKWCTTVFYFQWLWTAKIDAAVYKWYKQQHASAVIVWGTENWDAALRFAELYWPCQILLPWQRGFVSLRGSMASPRDKWHKRAPVLMLRVLSPTVKSWENLWKIKSANMSYTMQMKWDYTGGPSQTITWQPKKKEAL